MVRLPKNYLWVIIIFLVIIVQINTKRYLINCYKIYKLAKEKSQNLYIFSLLYIRLKTRDENLIISKKLFQIQDKTIITRSGLLYYTKSILTAALNNICTFIGLMNEARYISIKIIPNNNSMINYQLIDNQANNCNNLLLTKYKYNYVL